MDDILEILKKNSDTKYRDFQRKLIPNLPIEYFLGVRTPILKSIAKKVVKEGTYKEFLKELPHPYHDQNHLHGLILSELKDYDESIKYIEEFLPYMNCWEVTDTCLPKAFRKQSNKDKLIIHVKKWIKSKQEYISRYAIIILMDMYLDEASYKEEYLDLVAEVKSDKYYTNMAVSWYFATAFIAHYSDAVKYLEKKRLSPWVHNKAIQKAIESYRINDEQKEYLRSLKVCK